MKNKPNVVEIALLIKRLRKILQKNIQHEKECRALLHSPAQTIVRGKKINFNMGYVNSSKKRRRDILEILNDTHAKIEKLKELIKQGHEYIEKHTK